MIWKKLTMRWVAAKDMWHMRFKGGHFIQEFFDCKNIHAHFEKLDKTKDNHYDVVITKETDMSEEKAEAGRLTSEYSMKVINDKGIATIEGKVIIRDQSFVSASGQLVSTLEGLLGPAKQQVAEQG